MSVESPYQITGFQSPCSEYHEKTLSLDERYKLSAPSVFIVQVSGHSPKLGMRSGDKLIIDRSLTPRPGDVVLLVVNNDFKLSTFSLELTQNKDPETEDFVWGVVTTLLREFK